MDYLNVIGISRIYIKLYNSAYTFEIHNLSVFHQPFYLYWITMVKKVRIKSKTFIKFLRYELVVTLHLLQGCVWVGILKKNECKKNVRKKVTFAFIEIIVLAVWRHTLIGYFYLCYDYSSVIFCLREVTWPNRCYFNKYWISCELQQCVGLLFL